MQRWHLTASLTAAALLAVTLVPRLTAERPPAPPPPEQPSPVPTPPTPPPPTTSDTLRMTARFDQHAIFAGEAAERFLVVEIGADAIEDAPRQPVDLAVVLDASGSMSARGKIDFAKRAARHVVGMLQPEDRFTLVTFEDRAEVVVPAGPVRDPEPIRQAIDRIYEGGGTNLHAGLTEAGRELERVRRDGSVGRIVLLSDGMANKGVTDAATLATTAAGFARTGVTVSTIGLGLEYNEDLLARIADVAGGSYDFVDDPKQLERVFADEFERSAAVVARDVSVRIDLGDHIEPLELVGWDADRDAEGWRVWLGDLHAGDTRKIIARVRVHAGEEGDVPVAKVRAAYHDLIEGSMSSTYADATIRITREAAIVSGSIDREATIAARRAWGHRFLDLSARAYADGELDTSRQLVEQGRYVLEDASQRFGSPSLAEEARELQRQREVYESYEPSSSEGQRAIKGGKEMFRGRAR